jgi:hypothetical protein
LAEKLLCSEVYVPNPLCPPGKAAIDFFVVLNEVGSVASIAGILWMAYDRFIGSRKQNTDDDAGLYIALRRPDGGVVDLWIGKNARSQEEVERRIELIIEASQHDGDVVIEYERQIEELNSSDAWITISSHEKMKVNHDAP